MAESLSISRPFSNFLSMSARAISDVFSPAGLSIPCVALGVWASDAPDAYLYGLLYALIAIPVPVLYVLWLVKSGQVSDFHLPNRRDRLVPFMVSISAAIIACALCVYLGAPAMLLATILGALALTVAMFLITLFWQISIHTATTSGLVTFAVLAMGVPALAFLLLIPLVMWARLYLGRHTVAQTLAGALLGCVIFTTLFALRGIAW